MMIAYTIHTSLVLRAAFRSLVVLDPVLVLAVLDPVLVLAVLVLVLAVLMVLMVLAALDAVVVLVGPAETREAAENAITRTEIRERRMIVSRTSLIRIYADQGYLTAHGLFTGMTENS